MRDGRGAFLASGSAAIVGHEGRGPASRAEHAPGAEGPGARRVDQVDTARQASAWRDLFTWDTLRRVVVGYLAVSSRAGFAAARPVGGASLDAPGGLAPWGAPEGTAARRLLRHEEAEHLSKRPPRHELVLSRPAREEVAWIFLVPDFWHVTIYSNQTAEEAQLWPPDLVPQGRWSLVHIAHDTFAQAFAHHLETRYRSLAAYTVFSPAFPLEQSPSLLDMMAHPALMARVQAMSIKANFDLPPRDLQEHDRADVWYRAQRFSLRTLEPVDFVDQHVYKAALWYRERFALSQDANILRHFFGQLGIREDWLAEDAEVGSFAYGGLVGFTSRAARQHPPEVYAALGDMARLPDPFPLLVERSWLMLFAGDHYHEARPLTAWEHLGTYLDTHEAEGSS